MCDPVVSWSNKNRGDTQAIGSVHRQMLVSVCLTSCLLVLTGTDISTSSGIGFPMPSAASVSARSFPLSPSWPLIHLKCVGAAFCLKAYAAALIQGALGTLGHPESSQWDKQLVRHLMTYCESVTIIKSAFQGMDCSATTTSANSLI